MNQISNELFENISKTFFDGLFEVMKEVVVGQNFQLKLFLSCLVAGEHVSLVGESGIGKTFMVEKLIEFLGLEEYYTKITGHPEIMPQDFSTKYVFEENSIEEKKVRILKSNLFFVDEYNRISPKSLNILLDPLNNGTFYDDVNELQIKLGKIIAKDDSGQEINTQNYWPTESLQYKVDLYNKIKENLDQSTEIDDGEKIFTELEKLKKKISATISASNDKKEDLIEDIKNAVGELVSQKSMNVNLSTFCANTERATEFINNIQKTGIHFKTDQVKNLTNEIFDLESQLRLVESILNELPPGKIAKFDIHIFLDSLRKGFPITKKEMETLSEQFQNDESSNFFLCVLASNPTSRGGNFMAPDALLDRIGLEIQFDPLDEKSKEEIPSSDEIIRIFNKQKRKLKEDLNKAFVDYAVPDNEHTMVDFFNYQYQIFYFLHFIRSYIKFQAISPYHVEDFELKLWCKRFLGLLISPQQFIFENLQRELQIEIEHNREPEKEDGSNNKEKKSETINTDILKQVARIWTFDTKADLLEKVEEKIVNRFIRLPSSWHIKKVFNQNQFSLYLLSNYENIIQPFKWTRKLAWPSWLYLNFAHWPWFISILVIGFIAAMGGWEQLNEWTGIGQIFKFSPSQWVGLGIASGLVLSQAGNFLSFIYLRIRTKKSFKIIRLIKNVQNRLIKELSEHIEIIYPIEVGTSGRMVESLMSIIKSYTFIDAALTENTDGHSEKSVQINDKKRKAYYKNVFKKIGFYATCHRMRFGLGVDNATKWHAINYAIEKVFGEKTTRLVDRIKAKINNWTLLDKIFKRTAENPLKNSNQRFIWVSLIKFVLLILLLIIWQKLGE
jgi:MoxR-like ATPase